MNESNKRKNSFKFHISRMNFRYERTENSYRGLKPDLRPDCLNISRNKAERRGTYFLLYVYVYIKAIAD